MLTYSFISDKNRLLGKFIIVEYKLCAYMRRRHVMLPDSTAGDNPIAHWPYSIAKALVIGDEPLAALVSLMLARHKPAITATICVNGRKALSMAKSVKPRFLILCGTESVPRLNGNVIIREILRRACFKNTKVILLTASERIGRKAVAAGCFGYLLKPFGPREFESFLDNAVGHTWQS